MGRKGISEKLLGRVDALVRVKSDVRYERVWILFCTSQSTGVSKTGQALMRTCQKKDFD